jgi:hypothetical protein
LKFVSKLDLGIFSQKVAGILRFGALSPGLLRTLPKGHYTYVVRTNRAGSDLEFGTSFDL